MRCKDRLVVCVFVAAACAIGFFRLLRLGPSLELLLPEQQYELTIAMQLDGHGEPVKVGAALPMETPRQSIRQELVSSGDFKFTMAQETANRRGIWELAEARGSYALVYTSTVLAKGRKYELAPKIALPATYPAEVQRHLLPGDTIQSGAPEIVALLERLVPQKERRTRAMFNLGLALSALSRRDEAIRAFEGVLRLRPDDWKALLNLSEEYFAASNKGKAREYAEHVLKLVPANAQAARMLQRIGD